MRKDVSYSLHRKAHCYCKIVTIRFIFINFLQQKVREINIISDQHLMMSNKGTRTRRGMNGAGNSGDGKELKKRVKIEYNESSRSKIEQEDDYGDEYNGYLSDSQPSDSINTNSNSILTMHIHIISDRRHRQLERD